MSTVEEANLAIERGAQAICFTHNLLTPDDLLDLAEPLHKSGCGVLVRSPLAYGMLAGTWDADRKFETSDHRGRRWSDASTSSGVTR